MEWNNEGKTGRPGCICLYRRSHLRQCFSCSTERQRCAHKIKQREMSNFIQSLTRNKGMKICLLLCLCSASMQFAWSQDIHFSQFFEAPLLRNPSLAGIF